MAATTESPEEGGNGEAQAVPRVAVIGAGISGLAAAYELRKEGAEVRVFDPEYHPGGVIQSFSKDGYVWEKGPNTMAENTPAIGELIEDLDLGDQVQWPKEQRRRYIIRDGEPVLLPSGPVDFVTTKALSTAAKLRVMAEPLLWHRRRERAGERAEDDDESIGEFMQRHIGHEPVDYLLDPFLAGTAGADPASTSARWAFPELWNLEKKHGSLFVGALASAFTRKKGGNGHSGSAKSGSQATKKQQRKKLGVSFSFQGGLQTLANALYDRVGQERVSLGSLVTGLSLHTGRGGAGGKKGKGRGHPEWLVTAAPEGKKKRTETFDAVIVTAPLARVKRISLLKDTRPIPLATRLPPVRYQPFSVIINTFAAEDVKRPLNGFGVLIPSKEKGFHSLGTIFSSSMFPDRSPEGTVTFTTFLGGSRARHLASWPLHELQKLALEDLHKIVGTEGAPVITRHIYWDRAFPQYGLGYGKVLAGLSKLEKDLPGLFFAGNHCGGLAVGRSIISGQEAAHKAVEFVQEARVREEAEAPPDAPTVEVA